MKLNLLQKFVRTLKNDGKKRKLWDGKMGESRKRAREKRKKKEKDGTM